MHPEIPVRPGLISTAGIQLLQLPFLQPQQRIHSLAIIAAPRSVRAKAPHDTFHHANTITKTPSTKEQQHVFFSSFGSSMRSSNRLKRQVSICSLSRAIELGAVD
jgi:hypothetical protein